MMKLGMRAKMDQAERLVQAASALCGYPEAEEWEMPSASAVSFTFSPW